jgi:hypothetical protein
MKEIEESSEGMIHFKVRTFVSLVAGLVIGTNTINTVLSNISTNAEKIEYNEKAEDRRRANLEAKFDYRNEITALKKELKDCENQ